MNCCYITARSLNDNSDIIKINFKVLKHLKQSLLFKGNRELSHGILQ